MGESSGWSASRGIVYVLCGTLFAVLILLGVALVHYHGLNQAEDPRVLETRTLQQSYQEFLETGAYRAARALLDSVDALYRNTPGYVDSFERGVVENDRATTYLLEVEEALLSDPPPDEASLRMALALAATHVERAIKIYRRWIDDMGSLSRSEVRARVEPTFDRDHPALTGLDPAPVIEKRVDDLLLAQIETPRRLSVAYTNRGVIHRYSGELEQARADYEQAIALWPRNATARNNLNRLLNRPPEKRPLLEQLFPPDRARPD